MAPLRMAPLTMLLRCPNPPPIGHSMDSHTSRSVPGELILAALHDIYATPVHPPITQTHPPTQS
jgi:hypothetical protein